jgi:hypothetical protein
MGLGLVVLVDDGPSGSVARRGLGYYNSAALWLRVKSEAGGVRITSESEV